MGYLELDDRGRGRGQGTTWKKPDAYTGEQTLTIARTRLDEPSEGLAILVVVETLWSKINRAEGRRPYYSARPARVEFSLHLADRGYVLEKGRMSFVGSAAELRTDRALLHRLLAV